MGKQINFYMSENIQESFFEYLEEKNFAFLDNFSRSINNPKTEDIYTLYLYRHDYGKIIMRSDNKEIMNTIKSPVIEFSKTIIKKEQAKVIRGRLWLADRYNNEEGMMIKKEETCIKDYQMLVRWIKKHVPYQMIKKGEYFVNEYINNELIELQDKGFILII